MSGPVNYASKSGVILHSTCLASLGMNQSFAAFELENEDFLTVAIAGHVVVLRLEKTKIHVS
jgi:hypothetical protein